MWIGADAAEIGLVDQLGGLHEEVDSAAPLACVEQWLNRRKQIHTSFESILLEELSRSFSASVLPKGGWFESLIEGFRPVVKGVSDLRDPMHVYVQCLACAPVL